MKNLMLFISPEHDFLPEHKIATKIQIDNSLELGWEAEDIILATNFPYEYKGVKALLLPDSIYTPFCPTVSIINVIVELFDRHMIKKDEVWWYHDHDAYQLKPLTESELDLDGFDMALSYKGLKEKWDTGSIFFKKSSEDIFRLLKETANSYQINEEYALMAIYTNNLLWITESEYDARAKFVPLYSPARLNLSGRIKTLNLRYLFSPDHDLIYSAAKKPLKILHFHFSNDLFLDSTMYGKNSLKKAFMPKRLIKLFHKHGVVGINPKKLKNLMIYFRRKELAHISPDKRFQSEDEILVKKQISNSLRLGWNKKDIILVTNFPYTYKGIKSITMDDDLFSGISEKANNANSIFQLLDQGLVQEGELWWFHDINSFQTRQFKSSEVELDGAVAGFVDFGNFFFRKGSKKLFEWIRNRASRLNTSEAIALTSLAKTNYRQINTMYKNIKLAKILKRIKL